MGDFSFAGKYGFQPSVDGDYFSGCYYDYAGQIKIWRNQTILQELKQQANFTLTENGALTYASSMDSCLDLFATIGGLRYADNTEIEKRFLRAYAENPDMAMKLLFYARDARGGLGERRTFRTILRFLGNGYPDSVVKNLKWIGEMGRYDDFLVLMDTPCEQTVIEFLKAQLLEDLEKLREGNGNVSLLGKWLPSVNTSCVKTVQMGRRLARAFGMTERQYRKNLSALRKQIDIIENRLRKKDYTFDYEKQPGKAMFKYRKAFETKDRERYEAFLARVNNHEAVLHTDVLMPYEIIRPVFDVVMGLEEETALSSTELTAIETTWYSQEDFTDNSNTLVVVDGSGSMYRYEDGLFPIEVALSLGLYFAERNKGGFANHFITFSTRPKLVEIKGDRLDTKLRHMTSYDEAADTNIEAVFDLILDTAVRNKLPQEEMPERIFIVSDMEFNYCTEDADITNFEDAKRKFEEAGYSLPQIVFWNVASRGMQLPVTKNEQGVTLVSGCNARIFQMAVSDRVTPMEYMLQVLGSDRYDKIAA